MKKKKTTTKIKIPTLYQKIKILTSTKHPDVRKFKLTKKDYIKARREMRLNGWI